MRAFCINMYWKSNYNCITLDGQHSWFVDLKTGTGNAGNGQAPSPPDTILIANLNDVFDVLTGINFKLIVIQSYFTSLYL